MQVKPSLLVYYSTYMPNLRPVHQTPSRLFSMIRPWIQINHTRFQKMVICVVKFPWKIYKIRQIFGQKKHTTYPPHVVHVLRYQMLSSAELSKIFNICLSKSIFMSNMGPLKYDYNSLNLFSSKNINVGDHFFRLLLDDLNLRNTFFFKRCPIFFL